MGCILVGGIPGAVYLSFYTGGWGGFLPDTMIGVAGQSLAILNLIRSNLISILICYIFQMSGCYISNHTRSQGSTNKINSVTLIPVRAYKMS